MVINGLFDLFSKNIFLDKLGHPAFKIEQIFNNKKMDNNFLTILIYSNQGHD